MLSWYNVTNNVLDKTFNITAISNISISAFVGASMAAARW